MTNFLIPYTFVPGTKAKAEEVNSNFSAIKDELNTKAEINGDDRENFLVADATEAFHAVNKSQFDSKSDEINEKISDIMNANSMKYCIKNGNLNTSGYPDLFSYAGLNVYFKVGDGEEGNYPKLVVMNRLGETFEKEELNTLTLPSVSKTYSNVATAENAISSGYFQVGNESTKAFDGQNASWWFSNYQGGAVINNAYIGQRNLTKQIEKIRILQDNTRQGYNVNSFKIQISEDEVTWTDLQTVDTTNRGFDFQEITINDYTTPTTPYSMRIVALTTPVLGNHAWMVCEFEMYAQDLEGDIVFSKAKDFNLFIDETSSDVIFYDNEIYTKDFAPVSPNINDIWFDVSVYPLTVKIYTLAGWVETDLVPIGKVTVNGSSIQSGETFDFNNNNYAISNTKKGREIIVDCLLPNLTQGVSKLTNLTHRAPVSGWIYIEASALFSLELSQNSTLASAKSFNFYKSGFIPIAKDMYYKATSATTIVFYPCKGGN